MEKELIELFEVVKKAADAAASADSSPEEDRCIDALKQLEKFPVNYQLLVSTQVFILLLHLLFSYLSSILTFHIVTGIYSHVFYTHATCVCVFMLGTLFGGFTIIFQFF